MAEQLPTEKDPVVSKSLGGILLVSSVLMVLSLLWSVYDEAYTLRPWKSYQKRFVALYSRHLASIKPAQAKEEKKVLQDTGYEELNRAIKKAEESISPQLSEIDRETNSIIGRRLAIITEPFAIVRSEIAALVYLSETASRQKKKDRLNEEIESIKAREISLTLPSNGSSNKQVMKIEKFNFSELEEEFNHLQKRKGDLGRERAELIRPTSELREKRDTFFKDQLSGLSPSQIEGLQSKMKTFVSEIKQIHIAEVDLVDRCESCHLGIREPLTLTKADMGGEAAFTSHPNRDLLKIHNPERFGCSTCHNGNGRATTGVNKGHGRYKHWLWPLFHRENSEAGCHQCHSKDLVLEHADILNQGKDIFYNQGCRGCHRFEGFDTESEALTQVQSTIHQLEIERKEMEKNIIRDDEAGDNAESNDEANRLYAQANALRQKITNSDHEVEQLNFQSKHLFQERKKVGPSLKEVRVKIRQEWLPVWLDNPHAYRPDTKMPAFRLSEQQKNAVSAFIWQSGVNGKLPKQPSGNSVRGQELLETRGCLGCHAIGEGDLEQGGVFAANLSRVGEKDHYNYLVRWIHNPRKRTRPYCAFEKRDLGPEDYAKHGLPFVFDLENSVCPNDGHELQVQQMTVMPNLRLTLQEARDVASYLMSLKREPGVLKQTYPTVDYLDDPQLKEEGRALVQHFGCAGCHEIAGFEEEQRIGTELTKEGSKPIERLDFALLTHDAEHEGWYNHKGFFERKLKNPAIFDQGKIKAPMEKLRMPDFKLEPEEITAVTTFLLGSVDSTLPSHFFFEPDTRSQDIRDGWWLVKKYNCMGCHQIRPGQDSILSGMERYQGDGKEKLPPTLVGEGARVSPDWLASFLKNPAMHPTNNARNGVREYLQVRMPTFYLSDGEIRKIVRFFESLASQNRPYIPTEMDPLSKQEREMARGLFTSKAAPCLKCHATGNPSHDRNATAPNFLLARERLKPGWTERWMVMPEMMAPGTSMPSGLFRREGDRWVFAGPLPDGFRNYSKDHAELLVRYMFQLTSAEQRRLISRLPSVATKVAGR